MADEELSVEEVVAFIQAMTGRSPTGRSVLNWIRRGKVVDGKTLVLHARQEGGPKGRWLVSKAALVGFLWSIGFDEARRAGPVWGARK